MNKDQRWVNSTDPGILRKRIDVDSELLIFGYACTLFRDDQKALEMDQGKHLIPWNGIEALKIDRYDARGHLSELSQFESSSYDFVPTPEEKEIEKLCDKERYLALEPNEEEHLMYQEEEFKRLQQSLSNNEYGQVSYQYTDDAQPQSTSSNSEGIAIQEDFEPFVPSPLLDIPQNMILPSSKKENQIIEKAASYIAAHGSQVEIIVKTRQANNEKLGFMHVGSPLNPYYNFILDRIKHGRYRPGSLMHTQEEIEQNEDYLHPILSSSSAVESAPSIPNIAYKPSGDSSYDLLVKNIRNVQQTHEVPAEIHKPPPAKKRRSSSNKHMKNGQSSKSHNSKKVITVENNPNKIPPPNIKEIISKLLNFARTMGLHPSELAPNLLMKKSKNMEFLLPENPYHQYYQEQLKLLFEEKEEIVQGCEPFFSEDVSVDNAETTTDNTGSPNTCSEEQVTSTTSEKTDIAKSCNISVVEVVSLDDISEEGIHKGDENSQPLIDDEDSLGNYSNNSEESSGKVLVEPQVQSSCTPASSEHHTPNQPPHRPVAPVSFSIKKPKEDKLEIPSALPVEESSSEEEGDENNEKAVKQKPVVKSSPTEKTTVAEEKVEKKVQTKIKDSKPEHEYSKSYLVEPSNKLNKLIQEEDKSENTLQANDNRKKEVKVTAKPAPSILNGPELIEPVKKKLNQKRREKSTRAERQRDRKTERKIVKTSIDHVDPPPPPREVASPLPPSPLASPPPPDVDKVKKEERKKKAKVLINRLKNWSNESVELEEESSQDLESSQVQCNSGSSTTSLSCGSIPFSPMPPSKFTSFLPQGPDSLVTQKIEEEKKEITKDNDPKNMEEHLRKQVKKSLQELARNMASIITSSTDLEESPPLATIRRNTSVKGKSINPLKPSSVTSTFSSGDGSNKSYDGTKKMGFKSVSQQLRPSTSSEVRESLLKSLAKNKKRKKYLRDISSDSSSSDSSDSSSDSEEESTSDESSDSSKHSSKKHSHRKHSKHSHKKRKKHRHHTKKLKSSRHSKKSRRSHRKRDRRSSSSSSD